MPLPEAGRKGRCPGAEWRRARRSWTGAHGSGQQGPALGLSARQRGLAASGCGRRRAERKAGGNGEGRQSLKKFGSQGCLLSRRLVTQGVQVLGEGGGRLEERRRPKVPGGGAQGPAALAGGGGSADLVPGGPAGPSSPGFRRAGGRVSGSEERRGGGWPRAGVKQPNMGAAEEGEGCSGAPGLQCSPAVPRSGNVYLEAGRQQNTWPWAPWSLLLYFFKHSTLFAKFISHFTVSFRGP